MLRLALWICLALHVFSAMNEPKLGGPAPEALGKSQGENIRIPDNAEMSKEPSNANVSEINLMSFQDTRHDEEVTSDSPCSNIGALTHISQEDGSIQNVCPQSGAVVNSTFRFLNRHFNFADCRNRTLLQHKADSLYCSIHNQHQKCLSPEDSPRTGPKVLGKLNKENHDAQIISLSLSLAQVKRALDFLCRVQKDMNQKCALDHIGLVESCINQDVLTIVSREETTWLYGILDPCRHLEVTAMCTYETLEEACTESEARILTSLVAHYLKETQCSLSIGSATAGRRGHHSFVNHLFLVAILAIGRV